MTIVMDSIVFRELIPHRAPMVLIDQVVEYGPESISARRKVRPGDPFVTDERLEDAALLEVVAQTIAAGDALYAKSKGGKVIRGYLTGLTGVKVHDYARPGDEIFVEATCLKRMDGMGLFEASARVDGRVLVEGRFKLFVEIEYPDKGA